MNEYSINGKKYKMRERIPFKAVYYALKGLDNKNINEVTFFELIENDNLNKLLSAILLDFDENQELYIEDLNEINKVILDFFQKKMNLRINTENVSKS